MTKRKRWFLVTLVVLAVVLSYTVYSTVKHGRIDYYTVSELKSKVDSLYGQPVRVKGQVAPGSISWDDKTQIMQFSLADERESLAVVYQGLVPDDFGPRAELVVVGKYHPDGTIEASGFERPKSFCQLCH